jgi:hypothetical protein
MKPLGTNQAHNQSWRSINKAKHRYHFPPTDAAKRAIHRPQPEVQNQPTQSELSGLLATAKSLILICSRCNPSSEAQLLITLVLYMNLLTYLD